MGGDVLMVFVLCGGRFCVNSSGRFVSGDGNRAMVTVFSLFQIWILCG